jgi:hypothetical protein
MGLLRPLLLRSILRSIRIRATDQPNAERRLSRLPLRRMTRTPEYGFLRWSEVACCLNFVSEAAIRRFAQHPQTACCLARGKPSRTRRRNRLGGLPRARRSTSEATCQRRPPKASKITGPTTAFDALLDHSYVHTFIRRVETFDIWHIRKRTQCSV